MIRLSILMPSCNFICVKMLIIISFMWGVFSGSGGVVTQLSENTLFFSIYFVFLPILNLNCDSKFLIYIIFLYLLAKYCNK